MCFRTKLKTHRFNIQLIYERIFIKPKPASVNEEFDDRSEIFVRIVAGGRKWSLPTPKGNGRDVMYVCMYLLIKLNVHILATARL
jgi:hypothetical protein